MKSNSKYWFLIVFMIILAAASRFLPHWHNFTAVGAMGLFGAAYFNKKYWSFLVPLIALWFSDLILNNVVYGAFFEGFVWFAPFSIYVYTGFIGVVLVGLLSLKKIRPKNILIASLLASIVFFLVSNFGSFLTNPMYTKDLPGLLTAYAAGIPFFWNTLLANIVYTFLLIGVFEWVTQGSLQRVWAKA